MDNASVAGRGSHLSLIFFSRRERPQLAGKIRSCLIPSEYVVEETTLALALALAARSFRRLSLEFSTRGDG